MSSGILPIPGFAEPFSAMTHLFITPLFLVWSVKLLLKNRSSAAWTLWIFSLATLALLSISGAYHIVKPGSEVAKDVMNRLDHAFIFFMISATITAVHGIFFRGFLRWGIIGIAWLLAINAITLKSIFFNSVPEWLSLAFFLSLGWMGLITFFVLWKRGGLGAVRHLLGGAFYYTGGAILEYLRWPVLVPGVVGPHEVFHLLVIGGLVHHWIFVYQKATLGA